MLFALNLIMKFQNPSRKSLGVHLATRNMIGVTTAVEVTDKFVHIPFLDNLEQILQNDDVRARIKLC